MNFNFKNKNCFEKELKYLLKLWEESMNKKKAYI